MTERKPSRPPPVGNPPHPDPLARLSRGVDALRADVTEEIKSNEKRVEASQKAKRRANAVAVGAVLVAILALAVAGAALDTADNAGDAADTAQEAVDLVIAQRTESRAVACERENDTAEKINGVIDEDIATVQAFNVPNPNRTAEQQAQLEAFIAARTAAYEAKRIDLRDCSPEGIEAFYEGR